jgi:hypothetical protein
MVWTGAAHIRVSGFVLLDILVMEVMAAGQEEPGFWSLLKNLLQ